MHRTQNRDKPICVQLYQRNYFLDWRLSPSSFRILKKASKYVPIALGKVVSLSLPSTSTITRIRWIAPSCKWQHFLSRQFMHAFEYFTLRRTWQHQRGFPVRHVIHTYCELFSSSTCIALIRILVWRCQSKSAIWSYLNLVFFIRDRTSVASHLPIWPMYSSF